MTTYRGNADVLTARWTSTNAFLAFSECIDLDWDWRETNPFRFLIQCANYWIQLKTDTNYWIENSEERKLERNFHRRRDSISIINISPWKKEISVKQNFFLKKNHILQFFKIFSFFISTWRIKFNFESRKQEKCSLIPM